MERLLLNRFVGKVNSNVPDVLKEVAADPNMFNLDLIESCQEIIINYDKFKSKVRNGEIGKTAQFWLIYLDLMKNQHMAHTAVQENNFDMRLYAWEKFLPFYFALNKHNYSRYGCYYLERMKNIDTVYPGLKELLRFKGLSVQAQDRHPVRTSVDQRGEQTINRDAKTAGGIKNIATNSESVLKWCLNRSEQAQNTGALNDLCGISCSGEAYKALRPSQILNSEAQVSEVMRILTEEYLDPFDIGIELTELVNLSSGIPLPDDIAVDILSIPTKGEQLANDFKDQRLKSTRKEFHTPITRNNYKLFKTATKTVVAKTSNAVKTIEVNRNILGKLLYISANNDKPIDFETALKYPLSPIPLSICNADGSKRGTVESKLKKLILRHALIDEVQEQTNMNSYIIDMIACLRTMTEIPTTFEHLAWKLIKQIPTGYKRIDIVADTYR